jgi:hypothetical protein
VAVKTLTPTLALDEGSMEATYIVKERLMSRVLSLEPDGKTNNTDN